MHTVPADTKLRTGIIGCGKIASLHARALAESTLADFRGVCSRRLEKAKRFGAPFGVNPYNRIGEMIEQEKLDAVVVCTPHPVHAAGAIESMRAGAHVLVEKPLASSLADCDAMIKTAAETGKTLGMVSQRRFYEPCLRVREAIDHGSIGRPILGTATLLGWRDQAYYDGDPWRGSWQEEGGGVLVNQSPHQLDLLQWYMGPIDELYGYHANFNHPYIEVEDTAAAVLRFKNGGLATLMVSNSQNPALYGRVHIHGQNGATVGVQTDGGMMFLVGVSDIEEAPYNDVWTVAGQQEALTKWQQEDRERFKHIDAASHYLRMQAEDFLGAIIAGRKPLVTAEEGRVTVEIFTALYRAVRDGRPVSFPVTAEADDGSYDGRLSQGRS